MQRFTKIMFSADYFTGTAGHRLDPNDIDVSSGGEHWPFVKQPMRSWPNALAVTPDGTKLYVTLPGREGYPDSRVAVVSTAQRSVLSWIDLRPLGPTRRTRPDGIAIAPVNTAIFPRPYVVVTNEYANFASVIDTGNDRVIGEFNTGFYGEDLIFNASGTRLYITDRFNDQVRVFAIASGPSFTQLATVATGTTDLDRTNPRDLSISADGSTLYVANTLGHTIAVINVAGDANQVAQGGSGCASCHHNGNVITNGERDDTLQDFNIHEPGVVAEATVSNDGAAPGRSSGERQSRAADRRERRRARDQPGPDRE